MSRTYHHVPYKWRKDKIREDWQRWIWLRREPKWWRKIHKHEARRNELARAFAKLKRGADPDNLTWPLDTKPRVYYW